MKNLKVVISGGGIAGCFAGLLLNRAGHEVSIFEKRSQNTTSGSEVGRTVNFTLSKRGRNSLEKAGLLEEILLSATPLFGRIIHLPFMGLKIKSTYGLCNDDLLHCISRAELHSLLMKRATIEGVKFTFQSSVVELNPFSRIAVFETNESNTEASFDLYIGADGVNSKTRDILENMKLISVNIAKSDWHYTEEPSGKSESVLDKNFLHVWPMWNQVVCGLPEKNGELILNRIFKDDSGSNGYAIRRLKIHPWHIAESTILLGDAAHAISPFMGQGMNMALEDAEIFSDLITKEGLSSDVLKKFQTKRKSISDDLYELSENHFNTLARKFLNPVFILSENISARFRKWFPVLGKSKYGRAT